MNSVIIHGKKKEFIYVYLVSISIKCIIVWNNLKCYIATAFIILLKKLEVFILKQWLYLLLFLKINPQMLILILYSCEKSLRTILNIVITVLQLLNVVADVTKTFSTNWFPCVDSLSCRVNTKCFAWHSFFLFSVTPTHPANPSHLFLPYKIWQELTFTLQHSAINYLFIQNKNQKYYSKNQQLKWSWKIKTEHLCRRFLTEFTKYIWISV